MFLNGKSRKKQMLFPENEILIQMEKLCLISWKSGRLLMLQESGRDRIAAI